MQNKNEQGREPKTGKSTNKQNESNTSGASKIQSQEQEMNNPVEGDADSELDGVSADSHQKGDRMENPMEQEGEDDQEDGSYRRTDENNRAGGRTNEPNDLKEAEDNRKVNY